MLTPGIKGHAALRVTTENTALAGSVLYVIYIPQCFY